MTEVTGNEAPVVADTILVATFPGLEGERSFDCASIPAAVRLDMLKTAARQYVANRLNAVTQRHGKDEKVKAWATYDAAIEADPLQNAVAKPEGERPAAPNLAEAYDRAIADLTSGNIRKQGTGEPKARQTKDPLTALVTETVVREVHTARKAADPKYSFLAAKKEVGPDGIAYLNKLIEEKVAAGVDRAQLEKMREDKYIKPAKLMLGITDTKALKELPSIL